MERVVGGDGRRFVCIMIVVFAVAACTGAFSLSLSLSRFALLKRRRQLKIQKGTEVGVGISDVFCLENRQMSEKEANLPVFSR